MLSLYLLFSAGFIWTDRKYFTYDSTITFCALVYLFLSLSSYVQRLLLVAVDIHPHDSSLKEPIANQGCNVLSFIFCFLFLATPRLKVC